MQDNKRKLEVAKMIVAEEILEVLHKHKEVPFGVEIQDIAKNIGIDLQVNSTNKSVEELTEEVVRHYLDPFLKGKMLKEDANLFASLTERDTVLDFQFAINTIVDCTYTDIEYRCDDCDRIIGSRCKRGGIYYGYKHTDGREFCSWCYVKYNPEHRVSRQEKKLIKWQEKVLKPVIKQLAKNGIFPPSVRRKKKN